MINIMCMNYKSVTMSVFFISYFVNIFTCTKVCTAMNADISKNSGICASFIIVQQDFESARFCF